MSTNWEEVKRLAADFQRTQLSETLQRLELEMKTINDK